MEWVNKFLVRIQRINKNSSEKNSNELQKLNIEKLNSQLNENFKAFSLSSYRISRVRSKWLKDFIVDELLFEKSLTEKHYKDRVSFEKGVLYFSNKKYTLPNVLINYLKLEAGLAEVERKNGNLPSYAIHCFKQIELIQNYFLSHTPNRIRIGAFLLGTDSIAAPLLSSVTNSASRTNLYYNNFSRYGNTVCLVRKINFSSNRGVNWTVETDPVRQNDTKWRLSDDQRNKIFKACLLYDPFSQSNSFNLLEHPPSLKAFEHMKYFRGFGSHLKFDFEPLIEPQYDSDVERMRIQKFYVCPELVLDSKLEEPGFYQRYVDMVIQLYSEFYKVEISGNPIF